MGNDSTRFDNQKPQHQLFLPDYYISQYPLTNIEYARFIEAGGYKDKRWWTWAGWAETNSPTGTLERMSGQAGIPWTHPRLWYENRFNKPNQPVVGISWYECMAYCHWLSAETGYHYRLSTEAEWEKAARGTDGRIYPWGDKFEASRLNSGEGEQREGSTTPVGIYPIGVSPFGVFDCAGNVNEWCLTKIRGDSHLADFKPYPYDVTENEWTREYIEGRSGRALRGGSWLNGKVGANCTWRDGGGPNYKDDDFGCRLAVSSA
jgi:formylglycine-generating enzyme required for sulfatase activity